MFVISLLDSISWLDYDGMQFWQIVWKEPAPNYNNNIAA
jgi:hypothetical protein